jgi:2-pyrone-4,6-dicarboxylate lactonase
MTPAGMAPCPPSDPNPRPPRFRVPKGACDCHAHVFDAARHPYAAVRGYTPPDAPLAAMRAVHATLGIDRAVLTHASVHGNDSSAVLDGAASDLTRYRAVVSVNADITARDLSRMHAKGARGIRVNLVDKGGMPFASLDDLARIAGLLADMAWHVEFLVHVDDALDLWPLLRRLPVDAVIGHLGYMPAGLGIDHPGFRTLLDAVERGRTWVKLTGPYRLTAETDLPYSDVSPFASALVMTRPDRLLWGSDWPHVMCKKPMPNDGDLMDLVADWVPDAATRNAILVDNPARLYGF